MRQVTVLQRCLKDDKTKKKKHSTSNLKKKQLILLCDFIQFEFVERGDRGNGGWGGGGDTPRLDPKKKKCL